MIAKVVSSPAEVSQMQVFVGGGNAIFFLLTLLLTGFLALAGWFAWQNRNRSLFRAATGVGWVVIGVYFALLVTAALPSRERVLSHQKTQSFCSFPTSFLRNVEAMLPHARVALR